MQIGKAVGEIDRGAVDRHRTIGCGVGHSGGQRQIGRVNRQKPSDACLFQVERAGQAPIVGIMDLAVVPGPKEPNEHVEKMDADVGGQAARLVGHALPRVVIPRAAAGDIGEANVFRLGAGISLQLLAQLQQAGVNAQLQDGIHPPARLVL
jgi:hypothetical protein